MKNIIENKGGLNVLIEQKNTECKSQIFCNKVEYMQDRGKFRGKPIFDHHLMFWDKKKLVFKIWLKQNKEYKGIKEALKDVGVMILPERIGSKEELKKQIEKLSKGRGTIYPSDIMEKVDVSYGDILTALDELEKEGHIVWEEFNENDSIGKKSRTPFKVKGEKRKNANPSQT